MQKATAKITTTAEHFRFILHSTDSYFYELVHRASYVSLSVEFPLTLNTKNKYKYFD